MVKRKGTRNKKSRYMKEATEHVETSGCGGRRNRVKCDAQDIWVTGRRVKGGISRKGYVQR